MWVAFANAKATHIFLAKILVYDAIFNDQSFNDMLTNGVISLEQLGPSYFYTVYTLSIKTGLSKLYRSRSNVAECDFWSWSTLFFHSSSSF